MVEYIDKQAALAELNKTYDKMAGFYPQFYNGYQFALNQLSKLPTADVAEVRRGLRYRTGEIYACEGLVEIQCSECEETNLFDVIRYETSARYCPYCGAKWKRGADNGE